MNKPGGIIMTVAGKALSIVTAVIAAVLIIYSGYVLYDNFYIQNSAFSQNSDFLQYRPEIIDDGSVPLSGTTLAAINEDYRAWLTLYDTNIDYPVMQGENDLYYASHDIYKESSITGSIYMASASSPDFSDNYNLIYGHHVDNGSMFGQLDEFGDAGFFRSHRTGVLVTSDKVYDLTVFAALKTDAYDDMVYTVGNRDLNEVRSFVNKNAIQNDISTSEGADRIVVLSTCAGATTNGRFLIYAVMTERVTTTPVTPGPGPADTPSPASTDQPGPADTSSPAPTDQPGPTYQSEQADRPVPMITTAPAAAQATAAVIPPDEEIAEDETPLASFIKAFTPTGSSYGLDVWALINLIALIISVYLLIPVFSFAAKYGRSDKMKTVNENLSLLSKDPYYKQKGFSRKMTIGVILEIAVCVIAVIVFIFTEDMHLPMVLIDRWTPLMLLFLFGVWLLDVFLIRYRKDKEEDEENGNNDNSGQA